MAASDFVLFRNTPIVDASTSNSTSQVGEPSVANNGRFVLLTGNWYASFSADGGISWAYLDPYRMFPSVNGGFCCDQVAIYDASRDLMFWALQYSKDTQRNTLRIAISRGVDIGNNRWYYYDFSPDSVNSSWTNEWFDYPDLTLSRNFLYASTNSFRTSDDRWVRTVLLRLSLDQLAAGSGLSYRYYQSNQNFVFRCSQGARDTMHFASHNTQSQLRLYTWPESANTPTFTDINVTPWSDATRAAPGPDGRDWCGRADGRITGGWVSEGIIGFMWSSAQMPPARPFPFVKVARINESTKQLVDQPDIWNPSFAWMYPTVAVNDRGHLGLSIFYGGGTLLTSHAVGIDDDFTPSPGWAFVTTVRGTSGPDQNKWGDYLACRRHSPDGLTWIATGFVQQGSADRLGIEPRFVHFGRRRDEAAMRRWVGI